MYIYCTCTFVYQYARCAHVCCMMDASSDNTEPAGGEDAVNNTLADGMQLQGTSIFRIAHARVSETDLFSILGFLRIYLMRSILGFLGVQFRKYNVGSPEYISETTPQTTPITPTSP